MWFWRDSYFKTLKELAAEAAANPEWTDYAAYCTEHERGLRREAFTILNRFIVQMERTSFEGRRRFISWLLNRADLREGSDLAVPHPLRQRIIEPTLAEWLKAEPLSSEPHRWLGGYDHLKQAILLDPTDQVARRKFVGCILGGVDYSTHELPHGYLGDPTEDMAHLDEAEATLAGVTDDEFRKLATSEIADQKRLVEDYMHIRCDAMRPLASNCR